LADPTKNSRRDKHPDSNVSDRRRDFRHASRRAEQYGNRQAIGLERVGRTRLRDDGSNMVKWTDVGI